MIAVTGRCCYCFCVVRFEKSSHISGEYVIGSGRTTRDALVLMDGETVMCPECFKQLTLKRLGSDFLIT